jgi:uncharacterized protein (UPF0332 family)
MIWGEYVVLARRLAGYEFEAADRSAISRAYYGAFNSARRWLEVQVGPIADHRAHSLVWHTFADAERATPATKEDWREVGDLGITLRQMRNSADYADSVSGVDRQAVRAVIYAEQIMGLLPELELAD